MELDLDLTFLRTLTVAQYFDQKVDTEFDISKLLGTGIPRYQQRPEH